MLQMTTRKQLYRNLYKNKTSKFNALNSNGTVVESTLILSFKRSINFIFLNISICACI